MYLYNTSDMLSVKNTLVVNEDRSLNIDTNLLEFLNTKILTQFITFRDTNTSNFVNVPAYDILYNNSSNSSLDYTTLTLAYELTANRTNHTSVYPFYSLSNFSLLLPAEINAANYDNGIITDLDELKAEFRRQPTATLAMVDLMNKEYARDLHRLILLLEQTNQKK